MKNNDIYCFSKHILISFSKSLVSAIDLTLALKKSLGSTFFRFRIYLFFKASSRMNSLIVLPLPSLKGCRTFSSEI